MALERNKRASHAPAIASRRCVTNGVEQLDRIREEAIRAQAQHRQAKIGLYAAATGLVSGLGLGASALAIQYDQSCAVPDVRVNGHADKVDDIHQQLILQRQFAAHQVQYLKQHFEGHHEIIQKAEDFCSQTNAELDTLQKLPEATKQVQVRS